MTTIGEKVAHVKAAGQDRHHHCHWPGCTKQVPPAMWGCKKHWYKLPQDLRTRIWHAYRTGQENDMRPSKAYCLAAGEAQEWIRTHNAPQADLFTKGGGSGGEEERWPEVLKAGPDKSVAVGLTGSTANAKRTGRGP